MNSNNNHHELPIPIDGAFATVGRSMDSLWANLTSRQDTKSPERLLFVSSHHGEGASTIASCTAIGLARHLRQSVLLIEANTYKPSLAAYFGLPASPGFGDVIRGEARLEEAMFETAIQGLTVLPAGDARAQEPGEFASESTTSALARAERGHRYVLIDGPPVLTYPDSRLLLRSVDEAVLIVRSGVTKRQVAKNALHVLKSSGVWIAGVVVNCYRPDLPAWIGDR